MPTTATDMPNYRYGVKGVRIAMQTATGTYGTPWYEVGAHSIEESAASQNSTTFYSDDGKPYTVNGTAANGSVTVSFAEFSNDYNTKVLGHKIDSTTGAVVKSKDDTAGVFAAGWEVQGTRKKTKVWKLGCTSTEPTASFQSNGENVTEAPQSATWTINGDSIGGVNTDEIVCHEGDAGFATFLDAVPTAFTFPTQ